MPDDDDVRIDPKYGVELKLLPDIIGWLCIRCNAPHDVNGGKCLRCGYGVLQAVTEDESP